MNNLSLVTGAAGFVGGHLAAELARRGSRVRGLVRRESQADALRAAGIEPCVGDIHDADAVRRAIEGVEVVYHAASVGDTELTRDEVYETNLEGTRHVLEALRAAGHGRLVHVSGLSVLGLRNFENATEDLGYRRWGDPHGDVKVDAEKLVLHYHRVNGVEAVIVRPGLVYSRDDQNTARIVDAIRDGQFWFIGSRDNLVPMVHISDLVEALIAAGNTPAANGRIYNLTDGTRTTISQLVGRLCELNGLEPPARLLPYIIPRAGVTFFGILRSIKLMRGPGPIDKLSLCFLGTSRHVDVSRARTELAYEPRVDFHAGLAESPSKIGGGTPVEPDAIG